jgi:hypothetical protein
MFCLKSKFLLVLLLVFILPLSTKAAGRGARSSMDIPPEAFDEFLVEGGEKDAVIRSGFREGREDEAVFKSSILKGGDSKAVFLNELPKGALVIQPEDKIAEKGDVKGERVVPGSEELSPGGLEPGLYDGTKEAEKNIWALEDFIAKGGKNFRFINGNVFVAHVDVVTHKEPKWKWGSITTEKVELEEKWQKVLTGEKTVDLRVGKQTVVKPTDDYEVVRKMWSDDGEAPSMMNVHCPVHERVLVDEYQKYLVPVYKWEKVNVGTYKRKSFLAWVKRYRMVKRKHVLWKYWGSFDDFVKQYPSSALAAERAKKVTARVFAERRMLLGRVPADDLSAWIREQKPTEDPSMEFYLTELRKSIQPGIQEFSERDVPSAEIVAIPGKALSGNK